MKKLNLNFIAGRSDIMNKVITPVVDKKQKKNQLKEDKKVAEIKNYITNRIVENTIFNLIVYQKANNISNYNKDYLKKIDNFNYVITLVDNKIQIENELGELDELIMKISEKYEVYLSAVDKVKTVIFLRDKIIETFKNTFKDFSSYFEADKDKVSLHISAKSIK